MELTAETALAAPMVGDVNLFLKGMPGDEDFEVEIEVMIAGLLPLLRLLRSLMSRCTAC